MQQMVQMVGRRYSMRLKPMTLSSHQLLFNTDLILSSQATRVARHFKLRLVNHLENWSALWKIVEGNVPEWFKTATSCG